ncbi:glycoside hydrolase family 36 protein [Nonomuraea sp. NPDC050663]|uniref:glycoside hydrolase family 36 protein n=1 Tax=Nonomuraea sp. NPDC050663 TaxID=3364370 RepID=UPI00379D3401
MQIWQPHALPEVVTLPVGDVELSLDNGTAAMVTPLGGDVWLVEAPGAGAAQWRVPCVGAAAYWTPNSGARWIPPIWTGPRASRLTSGSPVASLVGMKGANVCTVALADVHGPTSITGGLVEETGEFAFTAQGQGLTILLDLSGRHFAEVLGEVAGWWAAAQEPPATPYRARLPVYSTWYSMHQELDEEGVERQARLAAGLGCATIIVDDGWQTADRARGYAFCGDWAPNPVAFPDPAAHVARVHELGLAYMLWYAIPFVGKDNEAFERFAGKTLRYLDLMDAAVLDPRHPDVRAFLADRLARAVEEWGMDGLKVDFVDRFATPGGDPAPSEGADCESVDEGVGLLLDELDRRLRGAEPELLIEYRQPYTSPGLWRFGNMVRAADCPLSSQENRQRTVDLRLIAGPQAVHADMIMWHPDESAEQVAVHLINALFSVPQISVDLTTQRPDQLDAVGFWLGISREHLGALQLGAFRPEQPEHGYPLVRAYDEQTVVVARYAALPVDVPYGDWSEVLVANADPDPRVTLYGEAQAEAVVHDCRGGVVQEARVSLPATVSVPMGGLLRLRRVGGGS